MSGGKYGAGAEVALRGAAWLAEFSPATAPAFLAAI